MSSMSKCLLWAHTSYRSTQVAKHIDGKEAAAVSIAICIYLHPLVSAVPTLLMADPRKSLWHQSPFFLRPRLFLDVRVRVRSWLDSDLIPPSPRSVILLSSTSRSHAPAPSFSLPPSLFSNVMLLPHAYDDGVPLISRRCLKVSHSITN